MDEKHDNMLIDIFAEHAHDMWAGWMKYMFKFGCLNWDGSLNKKIKMKYNIIKYI